MEKIKFIYFNIVEYFSFRSKYCSICKINKLNTNIILFFNLIFFYIRNLNKNSFISKKNKNTCYWYSCKNCKVFVNPKLLGLYNYKLLQENPYSRSYDKSDLEFREKYYLDKYKNILDFVLKNKFKKFCEISSDFGFLIDIIENSDVDVLGIEPEKSFLENTKSNKSKIINKLFEDSIDEINLFSPEIISFSSCFRSIDPNALNGLNKLDLKYVIINEANELINHFNTGFNLLKKNDFFYKFKSFNYSPTDIISIMGQRGFTLDSIETNYFDKKVKSQYLTSFYFKV